MKEDKIKFVEGWKYIDEYGQIWEASILPFKKNTENKYLYREESGLGLWNLGKGLSIHRN